MRIFSPPHLLRCYVTTPQKPKRVKYQPCSSLDVATYSGSLVNISYH